MADAPSVPSYAELLWPSVQAIRALGGSGSIDEIVEKVVELEGFTEEQQAVLHGDGPRSQIEYRLAWGRSYLKGMGLLDNSARGVWALTEKGRDPSLDEQTVLRLLYEYTAKLRAQQRARRRAERDRAPADVDENDQEVTRDWKEELLDALLAMSPAGFERLAQRLLREAGFISATVMGRSGDGGIDGLGVYRLSLVSFPVYFQCKRYRGSVGPGVVRDFRGAMAGRGDKGLVITTGSFTGDAKREATRDGAPPIDLIAQTVVREVREETGLEVEVTGIVGVYSDPGHVIAYSDGEVRQEFNLCFAARLVGGQLSVSDESTEVRWVAPLAIEQLPMHESIRLRIKHFLEHGPAPAIA